MPEAPLHSDVCRRYGRKNILNDLAPADRCMALSQSQSDPSSRTSLSLIRRAAQQDADAWLRLTDLYGPLVFHWCRRQGLGEHDAADVMQEVFTAVARAIDGFETGPGSTFRGWLWTITRNKLRDLFRRRARETRAAGGSIAWEQLAGVAESLSPDPDQHTDGVEMNALFRRGLELVRSEFEIRTWQMFWQSIVEERPTSEIAVEFDVTANAVRQARSRVLRRLRRELGDAP